MREITSAAVALPVEFINRGSDITVADSLTLIADITERHIAGWRHRNLCETGAHRIKLN